MRLQALQSADRDVFDAIVREENRQRCGLK